VILLSK